MRWALSLLEDLMPKCARFVFSSKLESYDLAHEMNLAARSETEKRPVSG